MSRATVSQEALIRKLLRSHVITDAEREAIERRLAEGFTRGTPSDCITWLQSEIKRRKAEEREAAEAQQGGLPL